ncbi:MAG TPA: hypothetical protein DHW71_11845 [Gammaproteobacteria bacterium]|nr:hypothetical protein [Gammaproteobacteria bacterium]MEC8009432.1 flagellar biosynthetic protein FliR [Pseudomonadota bacterium]HBF07962.1 hypothetical protein [Gammaproteobacteria bacterium]HCK93678.1 hypothetical protein [Gammaproteobacteria bacterium]
MNDLQALSTVVEDTLSFLLLTLPRIFGFFTGFPLLGTSLITSMMIRVCCGVAFAMFLHPIMEHQVGDFSTVEFSYFMLIKEFLIGWIAGFIVTLPLWVSLSIGDIVESQRGGMATDNADPFTGIQSSAYGALIASTLFMVIVLYEPFQILLRFLYTSYTVWEVDSYIPQFDNTKVNGIMIFIKALFDSIVLLGAPMLIMMFLCEFGLALVNRFSPPLNVFILSMPLKSMVSIFMMWAIFQQLIPTLADFFNPDSISYSIIRGLMS